MKKIMKKIITFLLLLSLSLSSIEMFGVKASDTTDVSPAFQVSSASIRFVNNDTEVDGIRFKVAIKTSVYRKLTNAQKDKYRLLIMPKALVSGKLEVGETYTYTVNGQTKSTKAMDLPIWWTDAKQQGDYTETYVYLNGINKSYYATDLVARMYYQENGGVPEYSDECQRSYDAVADAALSDLNSTNTGEYKNAVGSQYSPYNATKRNALLGVKYEKRTGTWDLVDGMLVTDGAVGANTFILERDNQLDLSQKYFVLETSIYVPKASDAIKDKLNGMVFGYGTDSYWVLDVNYRNHVGADKWLTNIRGFDSKGDNVANAGIAGVVYEEGWYDYRVCVDRSDSTQTLFTVEYKKQNETKYTTLLEKVSIKTSELSITGTRIGFLSTIAKNSENPITIQYGPNVKKTDGAVQLRGENQTLKLEKELHADGTGVIQGSMICDYRTTGDQMDCREGIKFSGTDGNGYLFYIGAQPTYTNSDGVKQPRLYVGMWKWNGTDWVNPDMSQGADIPTYNGMLLNQLKENDEYTIYFKIEISYNASNQKEFTTSWHWESGNLRFPAQEEERTYYTYDKGTAHKGSEVWLYSNDSGKETDSNAGDGKTTYYPITVSSNTLIEQVNLDSTVEQVKVALNDGERYTNPIPDKNQPYRDGSYEASGLTNQSKSGDPYILRYNGKYYLYVSNNSWTCSYRCWESIDLINYTYLGEYKLLDKNGDVPANDTSEREYHTMECPYAPEVHYWNGKFYMYTSPGGGGHFVFECQNEKGLPYGDYRAVGDKFDDNIDGTVFIDDDENKWFLRTYLARDGDDLSIILNGQSWIVMKPMSSMIKLQSNTNTKISKVGITGRQVEAPFLFERNGIYYLLASGEDATTPGYRLNYAYCKDPTVNASGNWYTEMEPTLLINTEGQYSGYGHGAVTIGPDLDSYWLPYHMRRTGNNTRVMAINRLEFSGTRMNVIGQDQETLIPEAPAFYTAYFDALTSEKEGVQERNAGYRSYTSERTTMGEGLHYVDGKWLSGRKTADGKVELIETGSRFTAEYNFKAIPTDGSFKCLFGGGYVTISGTTVELYKGNEKIAEALMLVNGEDGWDWSAYHDIIVTYEEGRITVTIDGCTKIDEKATGLGNGAIGYEGVTASAEQLQDQIGGAVFSNQAFGSSDKDVAKMAEGSFYASNYYEAKEGESASILTNSQVADASTFKEDKITYTSTFDKGEHKYHIYQDATELRLAEGDRAVYKIDVGKTGWYSLESLFSVDSDGSVIKIQIDDETPTCYKLRKNDYSSTTYDADYYKNLKYQKRVIDKIYLTKGLHTFTVKAVQGTYKAIEYEMNYISKTVASYTNKLSAKDTKNCTYYSSGWEIKDNAHYVPEKSGSTSLRGLMGFGNADYTDYSVKVEIKTDAVNSSSNAGILLRLNHPSVFEKQTYGSGKGYYVCLNQDGVSIMRFDYNERKVAHYSDTSLKTDTYYLLEAKCIDNTILVYLNGKQIMSYTDPYGYACGAAALYSNGANTYYRNLELTPE